MFVKCCNLRWKKSYGLQNSNKNIEDFSLHSTAGLIDSSGIFKLLISKDL